MLRAAKEWHYILERLYANTHSMRAPIGPACVHGDSMGPTRVWVIRGAESIRAPSTRRVEGGSVGLLIVRTISSVLKMSSRGAPPFHQLLISLVRSPMSISRVSHIACRAYQPLVIVLYCWSADCSVGFEFLKTHSLSA